MGDVGQMVSGESAPVAASVLGTVGQEVGAVGAAGATSSRAASDCLSATIQDWGASEAGARVGTVGVTSIASDARGEHCGTCSSR